MASEQLTVGAVSQQYPIPGIAVANARDPVVWRGMAQ